MLQESVIVVPELTSEQGLQKLLLPEHTRLVLDLLGVVVEGLKVVEGARELVEELPKEGGAAPPGGSNQDVSNQATFLAQPCLTQQDGGEIQRLS